MKPIAIGVIVAVATLLGSCCKDKAHCASAPYYVDPFIEKYYTFTCGGNLYEYEYIMRRKSQIDSITDCTFSPPVAFPIDETDFVYIMIGKMSYFYGDTFQASLSKDTCLKKLIYDVSMIQRDTAQLQFPGTRSMFCAVENIPPDYQVEVKYKYVPLPE
ncbi:MAG: hypothetical protein JNK66_04720 [Chitinophagales bacterium]|nr:hypothetical protein [Chitinophagales bacterium]